jgi:ferredoxin
MLFQIVDKKPKAAKKIAVIEPWCTGCGGAPVCTVYCKKGALEVVADQEFYPFHMMTVNHQLCVGCGVCVSKGKQGVMLSGCPWNAIRIESLS